jgi:hypothetical protein
MIYLVTVKLPRDPAHNPAKKVAGTCPVSGLSCTDVTGQHHTLAVGAANPEAAANAVGEYFPHITRVEACGLPTLPTDAAPAQALASESKK